MAEEAQSVASQYELGDTAPAAPAAPAASQSVAEAPAKDPRTGRFVSRVRGLARDLGMSDEEIDGYDSHELKDLVQMAQTERLFRQRESATLGALDRPAGAPTLPATPGAGAGGPGSLGLNEEDYDPGLMALLRRQQEELTSLRQQVAQVQGFHHAQVQGSVQARCDHAFARHKAHLGEARYHELKPDDPHLLRRRAVLQLVDAMKSGTLEERIDRAVQTLYGTTPAAAPAATTAPVGNPPPVAPASAAPDEGYAEAWRNGALARPTHRAGAAEPPGPEKAERSVASFLAESGGRTTTPTVAGEFPD
jgi:hypothetical protein